MTRWAPFALVALPAALAAQQPACPKGPADDQATMVSGTVAVKHAELRAAIDSTLRKLGYTLSRVETTPDQWVTVPRFTWPQGAESESWHGGENPGVQVVVDVEAQGDSTRVNVAASTVCALASAEPSGKPGSLEHTLETIAAVQVATELGGWLKQKADTAAGH